MTWFPGINDMSKHCTTKAPSEVTDPVRRVALGIRNAVLGQVKPAVGLLLMR